MNDDFPEQVCSSPTGCEPLFLLVYLSLGAILVPVRQINMMAESDATIDKTSQAVKCEIDPLLKTQASDLIRKLSSPFAWEDKPILMYLQCINTPGNLESATNLLQQILSKQTIYFIFPQKTKSLCISTAWNVNRLRGNFTELILFAVYKIILVHFSKNVCGDRKNFSIESCG